MTQGLLKLWARLKHFRSDADLDEELAAHLEMQAEDNALSGMEAEEARRQARIRLGSPTVIVERVRDQEAMTPLESWYADFAAGLRLVSKNPIFSVTAILTLTVGIGASLAIFSLLYGLLFRSLPATDPGRLAYLSNSADDEPFFMQLKMLEQVRRQSHSFTDLFALGSADVVISDLEKMPRIYSAALISGTGFPTLGMRPYLGRLLGPADDAVGTPVSGWTGVLGYAFWRKNFSGDPRILGKTIRVSDIPVTIVGVAPRDFHGLYPGEETRIYLPIQFATALTERDEVHPRLSSMRWAVVGRLKPGLSLAGAQADVGAGAWDMNVRSARSGLPSTFGILYLRPLVLMQGLVLLVLVFCCVNIGGLMISKVHSRQREFAVRTAIGAARWRLVRQYLTESFVIGLAGAAMGGAGAWFAGPMMLHFFRDPNMFEGMSVLPDGMVFAAAALLALLVTLTFGALPAWRASCCDAGILLKSRTNLGGRKPNAGYVFATVQVALSVLLVTHAALLSASLTRLRTERTGFDLDQVTIQTPPFSLLPQRGEGRRALYQRMVKRIQEMPGIRSAAVTWLTPMSGSQDAGRFAVVAPGEKAGGDYEMATNSVGPGYFRTMDTRILAGREFNEGDRAPSVCVVNTAAARVLFPNQSAAGRYVRAQAERYTSGPMACRVIGVSEDAKFASLRQAPPPTVYFPIGAELMAGKANLVFLMSAARKEDAVRAYQKAAEEIVPTLPIVLFVTLRDQMDAALGSQRLMTSLSNFFAGLAIFLSVIGLYGLLNMGVAERMPEIGMRIALGASRGRVIAMILLEAGSLFGAGALLGAVALCLTLPLVRDMLYGVSEFDLRTLLATGALTIVSAFCAGCLPAIRAAAIQPNDALRCG